MAARSTSWAGRPRPPFSPRPWAWSSRGSCEHDQAMHWLRPRLTGPGPLPGTPAAFLEQAAGGADREDAAGAADGQDAARAADGQDAAHAADARHAGETEQAQHAERAERAVVAQHAQTPRPSQPTCPSHA